MFQFGAFWAELCRFVQHNQFAWFLVKPSVVKQRPPYVMWLCPEGGAASFSITSSTGWKSWWRTCSRGEKKPSGRRPALQSRRSIPASRGGALRHPWRRRWTSCEVLRYPIFSFFLPTLTASSEGEIKRLLGKLMKSPVFTWELFIMFSCCHIEQKKRPRVCVCEAHNDTHTHWGLDAGEILMISPNKPTQETVLSLKRNVLKNNWNPTGNKYRNAIWLHDC